MRHGMLHGGLLALAFIGLLLVSEEAPRATAGSGARPPVEFNYKTVRERKASVRVRGLRGRVARISLESTRTPGDQWGEYSDEGEVYFRGLTDARGRCGGIVKIPERVKEVDLIVDCRPMRGPYTFERLRKWARPFAPSARVRVSVENLGAMVVRVRK